VQVSVRHGWLTARGTRQELQPLVARCRAKLGRSHGITSDWYVISSSLGMATTRLLMVRLAGHGSTMFNREFLTELALAYS
jgi:hypothetical protein